MIKHMTPWGEEIEVPSVDAIPDAVKSASLNRIMRLQMELEDACTAMAGMRLRVRERDMWFAKVSWGTFERMTQALGALKEEQGRWAREN